jgi:hypothetical protein
MRPKNNSYIIFLNLIFSAIILFSCESKTNTNDKADELSSIGYQNDTTNEISSVESQNNTAYELSAEDIIKSKDDVTMLEVTFTLSDGYDGDWMYFFTNNITGEEIVFTLPRNGCEYPDYMSDLDYYNGTDIENEGKSGKIYYTEAICNETVWEDEEETDDIIKSTRKILLLFEPFD